MTAKKDKAATLKKVGALLRKTREARDLSLPDVKRATGVSVPYLSDVELGRRSVSAARLRQIADAIGMGEAERQRLFLTAQMLPPAVRDRLAAAPQVWGYDAPRLLALAAELQQRLAADPKLATALGPTLVARVERALTKVEW